MINELQSVGDQLRVAWDDYYRVYSTLQNKYSKQLPCANEFSPELTQQLDIELDFISSYEPKIQQIKVAISATRNYTSGLAPINTLPQEILTRIFHLAIINPYKLHQLSYDGKMGSLRYPEYLTQVCALWRRVALFSRSLWSHIDLSLHKPRYDGLVARAETHLARMGDWPIELHIADDKQNRSGRTSHCGLYKDLYKFISGISIRVESLEFVITGNFQYFHRTLFTMLLRSQPLKITKLTLRSKDNHHDTFIFSDTSDSDDDFPHFPVDLPTDQVERAFACFTILHLHGIFPLWPSRAYHGLVDLRLLSTNEWSHIREAELVNILHSSPGLQIFHFGLDIDYLTPDTEDVTPVHLEDLRVLKIFPDRAKGAYIRPESVLRLLAPGPRPLRFCIGGYYAPSIAFATQLEGFFARSKVEKFYTKGIFPPMSTLLRHGAYLQRVVIDMFEYYAGIELPSAWLQIDGLASLPRLRLLHITGSTLTETELCLLLKCCPTGIILNSCCIERGDSLDFVTLSAMELSNAFPTVETTDYILYPSVDPTADWDILD